MKKTLILVALYSFAHSIIAQEDLRWSSWIPVYQNGVYQVEVSFHFDECKTVGGEDMMIGYSYWRTRNATACDKCWLTLQFDSPNCKGTTDAQIIRVDMSKVGIVRSTGDWFKGTRLLRTYNVKFDNNAAKTGVLPPLNFPNAPRSDNDDSQKQKEEQQALAAKKQQEDAQLEQARLAQQRREQMIAQVNAIRLRQQQQSQQIWNTHGTLVSAVAKMQQDNIRRNTNDLFAQRDKAFQELQSEIESATGELHLCNTCNGHGVEACARCNGNPFSTCPVCSGSGKVVSFGTAQSCSSCYGQGKKACAVCGGVGYKLCSTCGGKGGSLGFAALAAGSSGGLSSMSIDDLWDRALAVDEAGNLGQSAIYFKELADRGDARAQLLTGRNYISGRGVQKDVASALIYFKKSAEQGNVEAKRRVAELEAEVSTVVQVVPITGADFGYGSGATKMTRIANQSWITQNLNVDHFANGDEIPEVKSAKAWGKAADESKPAWCYVLNNSGNSQRYGKLYNWFAVADPRGLCPAGWHVPSAAEWESMIKALGQRAGILLKTKDSWETDNGKDTFGFSALPAGGRMEDGRFFRVFEEGHWWTSTGSGESASGFYMKHDYDGVFGYGGKKVVGYSVRCIKD